MGEDEIKEERSMECRAVINSLSDYLDGQSLWMPDSELRSIEDHLVICPNCQSVRLELTDIKISARELPLHTPPRAMWMRISNIIEAEVPMNERPTREELPEMSWWERLKSRKFTFNLPQLAGAGVLAAALLVAATFVLRPSQTELNFSGIQTALLPEEPELKAEIDQRLMALEPRKAKWDAQTRAEFEQNMARINESLKLCRRNLLAGPQDPIHRETLRALYNEQRQLLDDIERLKW